MGWNTFEDVKDPWKVDDKLDLKCGMMLIFIARVSPLAAPTQTQL